MAYKQPRVPPMKDGTRIAEYIRELILFLKDFCLETWRAVTQIQRDTAGDRVTSINGKSGEVTLGASDVGALPSDGTAADSAKLGGKAPEYYTRPRNLFDNSYWKNPKEIVNQRGVTTMTGDWIYTIDRWLVATNYYDVNPNGAITITDNGLSMGYWTDMIQLIEFDRLKGKTLTFATGTESGIHAYSMVVPETISSDEAVYLGKSIWDENIVMETIKYSNNDSIMFRIRNARTDDQLVYWAALYEGEYTAETLPPYIPKGYAVELMECLRYFRRVDVTVYGTNFTMGVWGDDASINLYLEYPMRIVPSLAKCPVSPEVRASNMYETANLSNPYINSVSTERMISIWWAADASGTYETNYFLQYIGDDSYTSIYLSADL